MAFLGIADEYAVTGIGNFYTVAAIISAVAALPPVHDIDHRSFATFIISSSEASRGSA